MAGPQPGTVEDGFQFIGGDPGVDANWQPVASQASLESGNQGGPPGASYDTVDAEMRAIVSKLPDDRTRQNALEQLLMNRGIPEPKVQGSGRDWYMVDPQSGGLKALTNTPQWDRYDALEGAMELPRVVGSAIGAAGGSVLGAAAGTLAAPGPGTVAGGVAGGMAGAGIGGGLADAATRAAMAYFSPEFRGQAEENMGAMAKDVGINAAIDAGTFGIAKGAGPAARALFGKGAGEAVGNVVNKGLVSPAMKGAGAVAETAGQGVAGVARAAQTPFGRSMATMAIPGAGEAEVMGEMATLPAAAARRLPEGMQRLGSMPFVNDVAPGAADWLRRTGQSVRRAASPSNLTEEGLSRLRVNPGAAPRPTPTAGGVLREVGERGARAAGASPGVTKTVGQVANVVGQGADALAIAGKGVASTARGVAGAGLAGAEAGGRGLQGAGWLLKKAGQVASPFESRAVIQAGGNEFKDYLERLHRERSRSNIEAILAGQ